MVSSLVDSHPTTFATVWVHLQDGYQTSWGDQRFFNFYGETTIPNMWLDGVSNPDTNYGQYAASLNQRLGLGTDVTIDLTGIETGTQQFDVRARVCVEPDGVEKTMRVYMVHALDHWPVAPTWYRNCVRQTVSTADVTVAPGTCEDVTRTFTFDATSWLNQGDIRIVAWAQVPSSSGPAEVYQAAQMSWPFPLPEEVFASDFEDGTTDDWSTVVP